MTSSGSFLPAALCLLLISVPGSQTDGVNNVIACEGSVAQIKCDGGQVISVQSANYGREDQTTCSSGRPASQIRNVHCSNPASKVATSCDGQSSCSIRASNSEFGDPCVGTYKYLKVDYICEKPERHPQSMKSVTCEGSRNRLRCGSQQVLLILEANYGRRDQKTCAARRPICQLSNIHCSNPAESVSRKCNGRKDCEIRASNSLFGDPCEGTYKYLEVDYTCMMKDVACEGSQAQLQCESGHFISVITANYGRTDRRTCSSQRPREQIRNVRCLNPVDSVGEKCNGRNSCSISATNSEFGDPCEGTYKYLEVNYICESNLVG